MKRELSMEFVRVTEEAAVAAARSVGRGDKNGTDELAVDAMRRMFDTVHIDGTVVIGEGELDEAPMLYIGEKVGAGGDEVDAGAAQGRQTRCGGAFKRAHSVLLIDAGAGTWNQAHRASSVSD